MTTRKSRRAAMAAVVSSIGAGMSIPPRSRANEPPGAAPVINARDFGARGDGKGEETVAFQRALDSAGLTGGTVVVPDGVYRLRNLSIRANTTLWLSAGAELHVMRATTAGNQLFGMFNDIVATTRLISARAGTISIEVESTAGLREGHRIVISGGTFKGSGVEEGPIEFNTVKRIESVSTLTVAVPLQYSYTSLGIPGAMPRVQSLGPASKTLRNVRITGGKLKPHSDFNSIYFNFANV